MEQFGMPLICKNCPPKHYYGVLKGERVPRRLVRLGKADRCPNCRQVLVPMKEVEYSLAE